MSEKIQNKFLVLKWDDIQKYASTPEQNYLSTLIEAIKEGRGRERKIPAPDYIVCNQDEPYSEKVWQLILDGEDEKMAKPTSNVQSVYMLYLTEGVGSEYGSKLIYIGTRESAQDLAGDLEAAANGRYIDFTLEETVSINGIVIWNKAIDI